MAISRSVRLRVAAGLLAAIGAAGFGFAWMISRWPRVEGDPTAFVNPSGGTVKAEIIPLLSQIGGAMIGAALAIWIVAQILARRDQMALEAGIAVPTRTPAQRIRTILLSLVMVVVVLGGTLGYQWYSYVTAGESPYEEVGIGINSALPAPLRIWGCAQIEARFPGALPPVGCGDETGRNWISQNAR